jgi:hypothetical protein
VMAATRHSMPTVAVVVATPLSVCLKRQGPRPANRRGPEDVVRSQHQAMTPVPPAADHIADIADRLRDPPAARATSSTGQERQGRGSLRPTSPGRRPGQPAHEPRLQDRLVRLTTRRPRPGRARHRHLREVQGAKPELRPIVQHVPLPLVRCGRAPTRKQHHEHRRRGAQETQDGRLR